jgi:hypothetical protein
MYELNNDYYKAVIEQRRRETEAFFYGQRLARSQREAKPTTGHTSHRAWLRGQIGGIRRTVGSALYLFRGRAAGSVAE